LFLDERELFRGMILFEDLVECPIISGRNVLFHFLKELGLILLIWMLLCD